LKYLAFVFVLLDLDMGWQNAEGKCVFVSDKMDNIYLAAKYCNAMGGIIFEPSSPEQQLAVDDLVAAGLAQDYWIGITDMEIENE
jgi:hypothetical protein